MITEQLCMDIVRVLHLVTTTSAAPALNLDDSPGGAPTVENSEVAKALPTATVYGNLLCKYQIPDIDEALRWLEIGGYIGHTGYGLAARTAVQLTEKGLDLARRGRFGAKEVALVYSDDPYTAFVAYQFNDPNAALFQYLRCGKGVFGLPGYLVKRR